MATIHPTRVSRKEAVDYAPNSQGQDLSPTPPVYEQGVMLANLLGEQAIAASRAAWEIEAALRAVRLAETEKEKIDTVRVLATVLSFYDRLVETKAQW